MKKLEIEQFTCLSDNYGVLLHEPKSKKTAAIDVPEAKAVLSVLERRGWQLSHIFITHHHADHIGGLAALKAQFSPKVIGPKRSAQQVSEIDSPVGEGDQFVWAGHQVQVFETPGHTLDHISYWFEEEHMVFAGDTLFSLGCGRLFEGDAGLMYASLQKLANLPDNTRVYCGHEYTLSNARFAISIDPDNMSLKARAEQVERLRQAGLPTVPTTIGLERQANPFLRVHEAALQKALGMEGRTPQEVFAHIRKLKDQA